MKPGHQLMRWYSIKLLPLTTMTTQGTSNNAEILTQSEDPSPTLSSLSSETSSPEQTTSFSKKGNDQNSPTPPECPKQGPIPPDCTMKPKF